MPDLDLWWEAWGRLAASIYRQGQVWLQVRTPAEEWANMWADAMLAVIR